MRKTIVAALAVIGGATSLTAFGQVFRIFAEAPLDRAVDFPRERLNEIYAEMAEKGIITTRLLEGGEYNVNIRFEDDVTRDNYETLVHPDTIDVWIVQQGGGTLVTGGRQLEGNKQTGGVERRIGVGDVIFIPAGVSHGMVESESITFLNIRFPEHRN